jgi:hypothetical protein
MKKNILLVLSFFVTTPILSQVPLQNFYATAIENQEESNRSSEFEDFFGIDEATSAEPLEPHSKKEKLSRFQIFMMKMGASVILAVDNAYEWFCAFWAYVQSLVQHERKT